MKNLLALILFLIPFGAQAGLFGSSFNFDDEMKAEQAIKNNDLGELKEIVGDQDLSKYDQLLDYALIQPSSKSYVCRTKIVEFLISKGIIPSENTKKKYRKSGPPHKRQADVSLIAKNSCSKILKSILNRVDPKDLAKGSLAFDFIRQVNDAKKPYHKNSGLGDRVLKTYEILDTENGKNCKNGIQEACKAKQHLNNELARLQKLSESMKFSKTPEATKQRVCKALSKIKKHKGYINRQKRIASNSGTVDIQDLHSSGERIVELEDEIKKLTVRYKEQTGKTLNLKQCQ